MKRIIISALIVMTGQVATAQNILIAAAADLKPALDKIVKEFSELNGVGKVSVSYGSSGTFLIQIQQGAPYDIYFSADIDYPKKLVAMGLAQDPVKPYAVGRLVLWSSKLDATKISIKDLTKTSISKIGIANPKHAPYGMRAVEAIKSVGVYDDVVRKFVFGENVSQAAQWVMTGNAEVGIIALSLALSDEMRGKGKFTMIDDKLHQPIDQGFVITKKGINNKTARDFSEHMNKPSSRIILEKYGFVIPK